jgi:hypothetical protein
MAPLDIPVAPEPINETAGQRKLSGQRLSSIKRMLIMVNAGTVMMHSGRAVSAQSRRSEGRGCEFAEP